MRYLQTETDYPITPPENDTVLTPNAVSSLNFNRERKSNVREDQKFTTGTKESKIFNIGVREYNMHKIKLPALDISNKTLQTRKLQKAHIR